MRGVDGHDDDPERPDLVRQKIGEFLTALGIEWDKRQVRPILKCFNPRCPDRSHATLNLDVDTVTCPICGGEWDIYDAAGVFCNSEDPVVQRAFVRKTFADSAKARNVKKKIEKKRQREVTGTWKDELLMTDEGGAKGVLGNLSLIFANDEEWRGKLSFDVRTQKVVFSGKPPEVVHSESGEYLLDEHTTRCALWLQSKYQLGLRGNSLIFSAMVAVAHEHPFDPVRDWLEALESWDTTSRLDNWIAAVTGCDDGPYETAVGRRFLISAVARVFDPGCKVDSMLILHGAQGTMKSKMLAELAVRPEWFSDHLADIGGKDAALQLCGPWILEMAELDALTGKRENERVKAWLTQQHDRFRPPYGRSVVDVPRRVVFAGTSNLDQFLRDETGGRRFWPIKIREINIELLQTIRVQLWAEALHVYRSGERWWLEGDEVELAKEQQEDRRVRDPWEDTVPAWLDETDFSLKSSPMRAANGRRICTTAGEILTDAVKVPIERQTKQELDRIGRILGNKLGWVRGKRRIEGRKMSVWYPPEKAGEETVVELVREEREKPAEQSRFGGVEDW